MIDLHRQLEAKNRLIEHFALTDPLTGLPNRRAIESWGAHELPAAVRHGFSFWVVVIDLDRFKRVNDAHGHEAGDTVLKAFGEILKSSTRSSDISGRIGVIEPSRTDATGPSSSPCPGREVRGARRERHVMESRQHWNQIYRTKGQRVSWFEPVPAVSLELLDAAGLTPDMCVLDVGGGEATLVDALLARGLHCVSVLDVSAEAIAHARARLGTAADTVHWIEADVVGSWDCETVDIWHDRALFHFLASASDRDAYKAHLLSTLKRGGAAVIGTFALDGPDVCSGLPVTRYSAATLARELGTAFTLEHERHHTHVTPWGTSQAFQFATLRRVR